MKEVTKDNFKELVENSKIPVLLDFYAEWCGPCKTLAPTLEELATELEGKVSILKVNVDENSDLAQEYGIRGIPTLLFFKKGDVKFTLVGNQSKDFLLERINEA